MCWWAKSRIWATWKIPESGLFTGKNRICSLDCWENLELGQFIYEKDSDLQFLTDEQNSESELLKISEIRLHFKLIQLFFSHSLSNNQKFCIPTIANIKFWLWIFLKSITQHWLIYQFLGDLKKNVFSHLWLTKTYLIEVMESLNVFHSFRSHTLFLFLSKITKLNVAIFSSSVFQFVDSVLQKVNHQLSYNQTKFFKLKISLYPEFVLEIICVFKNALSSFKNSFFLFSGHPFIGLDNGNTESHFGLSFLVDVPGIFFPVSSCTHQQ